MQNEELTKELNLLQVAIPLIFLIAIVLILRYMYKEYKKSKSKVIILTDEQMGDIEDKAKYARKHYRPHWDRFNMLKYVEYLEYKASKG